MKILICDDEPRFVKVMIRYLKQYEQETQNHYSIFTCQRAESMMDVIERENDIDLIFLDVVLADEDGIEMAGKIRGFNQKVKIIFISSHVEYAVKGYDVDAAGYMLKPLDYREFKNKMNRMIYQINDKDANRFWDRTDKGKVLFEFCDILYLETYGRNVRLHTRTDTYTVYRKMKYYETLLWKQPFFRCHSAYIVNMQEIQRIDGTQVYLKEGSEVMVSKARRKEFMQAFLKYVEGKVEAF